MRRVLEYSRTRLTPVDYIKSKREKGKLNIGWCSYFPPSRNGVAAYTHEFLKFLMKKRGVKVFAIPIDGRIQRELFPGAGFARLGDKKLDAVVFFCTALETEKMAKKCKGKTLLWQTVHESPLEDKSEKELLRQSSAVDRVVVVTRWAREEYWKAGREAGYIPLGIDVKKFSPKGKGRFEALFVSRIHDFKGVITFLETVPAAVAEQPEIFFRLHAPLDVYSPHLKEIMGRIKKTEEEFPENFSVESSWLLYERVAEKYAGASVLVFPSVSEGFAIPIVEAMGAGMPCIVADKKPMNELVEDGKTGYCLKQKSSVHGYIFPSPKEIAGKTVELSKDKKLYLRMSSAAREKAVKEYNIEGCAGALLDEIRKML